MASPSISPASGPPDPSQDKSGTYGIDPRYQVILTVSGDGGGTQNFYSSVEETLALSLTSQWSSPFENMLNEVAADAAGKSKTGQLGRIIGGVKLGSQLTGMQLRFKPMTAQVWQSSTPMELTIPFTFVAITDARKDILEKVTSLLKLAAPSQDSSFHIQAPGPVLLDPTTLQPGGRKIKLSIGKYATLEPCVIKNVNVQFENVIGEDGIPLRAKVTVEVASWYSMFTVQDIDAMFGTGGG